MADTHSRGQVTVFEKPASGFAQPESWGFVKQTEIKNKTAGGKLRQFTAEVFKSDTPGKGWRNRINGTAHAACDQKITSGCRGCSATRTVECTDTLVLQPDCDINPVA